MKPSGTYLQVSRIFQAKREHVFEAWVKPELMKKWFCPQELTVGNVSAEAKVGGKYSITMKDPNQGKVFTTFGTYKEIIPNQKLVFTWEWEQPDQAESVVTVDFKDKNGGTEVTVTHERFVDMKGENGHLEGWQSALVNLEENLFSAYRDSREIVMSRVFNAPREVVWEAWTNPKHVVNWWGPNGFSTTIEVMNVTPGGLWKHVMHGPDGTDYPNKSIFVEVKKPEKIVFKHAGGLQERGGACFQATWTFEEEPGGKTKLTGRLTFESSDERDHTAQEYGAIEGGKQTLARLETYLASGKVPGVK